MVQGLNNQQQVVDASLLVEGALRLIRPCSGEEVGFRKAEVQMKAEVRRPKASKEGRMPKAESSGRRSVADD